MSKYSLMGVNENKNLYLATWLRFGVIKVLFIAVLCQAQHSWAGAWTLPKGRIQTISGLYYSSADQEYDADGNLSYDSNFSKSESSVYIEYGINDKWMLVGQTALQSVNYQSRYGVVSQEGFGASQIGLQRKIWGDKKRVASVKASLIIAGPGENVPDADLGRGGNGAELRALFGSNYNVAGKLGFLDMQGAWINRRGQESPASYHIDLTAGQYIKGKHQLIGQLFYQQTDKGVFGADVIQPNQSLKGQLSWLRPGRRAGRKYQIGLFQTLGGKNIIQETGVVISVWNTRVDLALSPN